MPEDPENNNLYLYVVVRVLRHWKAAFSFRKNIKFAKLILSFLIQIYYIYESSNLKKYLEKYLVSLVNKTFKERPVYIRTTNLGLNFFTLSLPYRAASDD